MRSAEPAAVNEHGEPMCPVDGAALDTYPDGTLHCWRCSREWDSEGA